MRADESTRRLTPNWSMPILSSAGVVHTVMWAPSRYTSTCICTACIRGGAACQWAVLLRLAMRWGVSLDLLIYWLYCFAYTVIHRVYKKLISSRTQSSTTQKPKKPNGSWRPINVTSRTYVLEGVIRSTACSEHWRFVTRLRISISVRGQKTQTEPRLYEPSRVHH